MIRAMPELTTISASWWAAKVGSTAPKVELRRRLKIDPTTATRTVDLALLSSKGKPPSLELARRRTYYRALELGAEPDPELEKTLKAAPAASQLPANR